MLLFPSCIPCILSGIGEILTTFPTHLLSAPCSLVLLEVIIREYFLMIPFLICLLDFWCDRPWTWLKITKLGPTHTFCHSPCIISGTHKTRMGAHHGWIFLGVSFGLSRVSNLGLLTKGNPLNPIALTEFDNAKSNFNMQIYHYFKIFKII
jgi:hypothetical protein